MYGERREVKVSSLVEQYREEIHVFRPCKTKADARALLEATISSQDKIESLNSEGRGYRAKVLVFVARDYPTEEKK